MVSLLAASVDHPRLRGEYTSTLQMALPQRGSPPLARGVLWVRVRTILRLRITPACAGSTKTHVTLWSLTEDHPRLRGEYYL